MSDLLIIMSRLTLTWTYDTPSDNTVRSNSIRAINLYYCLCNNHELLMPISHKENVNEQYNLFPI